MFEGALELLEESARIAEAIGFPWWLAGVRATMASTSLELGRPTRARAHALDALALSHGIGDRPGVLHELALLAEIEASIGDTRRAALLRGAVEAESARTPLRRWLFASGAAPVVAAPEELELDRDEGRKLSLDEAIARALDRDESAQQADDPV